MERGRRDGRDGMTEERRGERRQRRKRERERERVRESPKDRDRVRGVTWSERGGS